MDDFLTCCIDGCTRRMGKASAIKRWGYIPGEWICSIHWRRLSKRERRVWGRIKRIARRYGWEAIGPERDRRLWRALRRRAGDRPPDIP